ncbi:hypothetical protein KP509_20G050200 [Ceratopteris richardii]|uniref:Extra-large guanine nucleotide-binding protein 3-like n=1 Tax=Ceratopteris richardii TaxID=49495 RepID=A0A8T2SH36_CERRI|nr:hypothetical protein KP509_20G050200 [Ceratopteris richardii]
MTKDEDDDEKAWRSTLQSMLPPGVPVPDAEKLDYSFAAVYEGPRPTYNIPKAESFRPTILGTRSVAKEASSSSKHITAANKIPQSTAASLESRPSTASLQPSVTPVIEDLQTDGASKCGYEGDNGGLISGRRTEAGTGMSFVDEIPKSSDFHRISALVALESSSTGRKGEHTEESEIVMQNSQSSVESKEALQIDSEVSPEAEELCEWNEQSDHPLPASYRSPSFATSPRGVDRFESFHVEKSNSSSDAEANDLRSSQSDFRFSGVQMAVGSDNIGGDSRNGIPIDRTGLINHGSVHMQRNRRDCHFCSKGNSLQEREACLVCKAKFCRNCILREMGSMPEGRKCVDCIGQPINEAKRSRLGKPSRLLQHLLSPLEVHQIMKAERECLANQLRPEQLIVNDKQLQAHELAQLLGCSNPPSKLKPGRYWYDKQSGLWGKEGEKPDKIITAELNVGGRLQEKATNGFTDVYMNGREITKIELRMLKCAGVQCTPGTHLWVYPDGNYQEEGQNNELGNIYGKATTRFLYALCALPTPNSSRLGARQALNNLRSIPAYLEQKKLYKLLLLGHEGSGTSTIFKQAKFLYNDGFNDEELETMKLMIQSNIYKYIGLLLEGRELFEDEEEANKEVSDDPENSESHSYFPDTSDAEPSLPASPGSGEKARGRKKNPYTISARLKHQADWILEIMANGHLDAYFPAATREYAPFVSEMWKDSAIQATYKRKSELHMLPDVADYFLERVADISSNDYVPSDRDILFAEGVTQGSGLAELEFSLDERSPVSETYNENYDQASSLVRYHLIRLSSKGINPGCKWLEMFEDVRAVIFCVALDEYDRMWTDGNQELQNKMLLSRDLFQCILEHPCFRDTPFVLLLNKYDSFEDKIQNVPLRVCEWFADFDPVRASTFTAQSLAQQAYTYIAHKFKKHFESINNTGRKLYTFQLKARERSTVSAAFQYVKEILKWEENKASTLWNVHDESMYTSDMSSFSPIPQYNGK